MVARSLGEEGDRPMDLHTYAGVVEDNYQRLADILLSPAPDASKVQRLLSLDLLPAPLIPRGYAIWSEGLLAEAFVCFPTAAFPALFERRSYRIPGSWYVRMSYTDDISVPNP